MTIVKDVIFHKKLALRKKVSFAFLSGALLFQSGEMIKLWAGLSQRGPDTILDEKGDTPLHLAVRHSWPEATKILLTRGASIHSINYEDESVLTLARNIYREYQSRVEAASSYNGILSAEEADMLKFAHAKQVLEILDRYKYADHI